MIIKRKRQRITIAFGYHYILVKKLKFYPLIRSPPRPSENLDFLLFITVLRAYKAL